MKPTSPRFFVRQPEQFGGKIPFIVTDLIEQLKKMNAVDNEGIFRLSGSAKDLARLCSDLNDGRVKDFSSYNHCHTIACTLKRYFRDMLPSHPLFPHSIYQKIISIPLLPDKSEQVKAFKEILDGLPNARRLTIVYIFKYFMEIEANKEKNKMNAQNLAIVLAPNFICTADSGDPGASLANNAAQNRLISTLIVLGHQIFDDYEVPESAFIVDEDMPIISLPPVSQQDIKMFIELRTLRRKSVLPYLPFDSQGGSHLVRPTREAVL